jgi:major type 1 subunit fimbrin (pilin)
LLTGCPAGLGSISYKLDPANPTFNAAQGVLTIDAGGAACVRIHINDDNNPISQRAVKQSISAPAPGNYSIPLHAAFY